MNKKNLCYLFLLGFISLSSCSLNVENDIKKFEIKGDKITKETFDNHITECNNDEMYYYKSKDSWYSFSYKKYYLLEKNNNFTEIHTDVSGTIYNAKYDYECKLKYNLSSYSITYTVENKGLKNEEITSKQKIDTEKKVTYVHGFLYEENYTTIVKDGSRVEEKTYTVDDINFTSILSKFHVSLDFLDCFKNYNLSKSELYRLNNGFALSYYDESINSISVSNEILVSYETVKDSYKLNRSELYYLYKTQYNGYLEIEKYQNKISKKLMGSINKPVNSYKYM